MTERKILLALNKIKACKDNGYDIEALVRTYALNISLMRFLLAEAAPKENLNGKKTKSLLRHFINEIHNQPELKALINKKSLKTIKTWLTKMDHYLKDLKSGILSNPKILQSESEKISGLLKISASKVLLPKAAAARRKTA